MTGNPPADGPGGRTEIYVRPAAYEVSGIPGDLLDAPGASHWIVHVTERGGGRWSVSNDGLTLSTAGAWDDEPPPSGRTSEWLDTHRFPYQQAEELARTACQTLHGYSIPGMIAELRARKERHRG